MHARGRQSRRAGGRGGGGEGEEGVVYKNEIIIFEN